MTNTDYRLLSHKTANLEGVSEYLGSFSLGSVNYGLEVEGLSDRDYLSVYMPNLKELFLKESLKPNHKSLSEEVEVQMVDVRYLLHYLKNPNPTYVQLLWSKNQDLDSESEFGKFYKTFTELSFRYYKLSLKELTYSTLGEMKKASKGNTVQPTPKSLVNSLYRLEMLFRLDKATTLQEFQSSMRHANKWHLNDSDCPNLLELKKMAVCSEEGLKRLTELTEKAEQYKEEQVDKSERESLYRLVEGFLVEFLHSQTKKLF